MASSLCPIPNNINPLSPTGFRFSITKLPGIQFFCQDVTLPEISLPEINVMTPLSTMSISGEILNYGDLTLTFLINEDMDNYAAIYDWLTGVGFPENHDQYSQFQEAQRSGTDLSTRGTGTNFSDGVLEILGSNNKPVRSFGFVDLHPTSLTSLRFESTVDTVNYLIGSCSFRYTYFKLLKPVEIPDWIQV